MPSLPCWLRLYAAGLVSSLLLLPAVALGQDLPGPTGATSLNLEALLVEVRSMNPSLRAARLESEALATRSRQESALPDPMVMLTYQPLPVLTARGTQRTQWRLEQAIPFPGKLGLMGEIAELSSEVGGFEAATLEQDLLFLVKQAYYELYRIQNQATLMLTFQDQLLEFEEVAAVQYAVGTGIQQAILKAQLEKNTLAQRLVALEAQRRSTTETLARLLNRPVGEVADLRLAPPPLPAPDEAALLELAMARRPEASALDIAEERAEKQIALARKQFLPDFGLSLTYMDIAAADAPPTATGRDALAIGASVKVPIQRGRLRARLEEARLRRAQVEARQEALETAFRTQIADLVSQMRRESEQLTLFRDLLIPQAQTTLEATLSAYTTARTDFLNLLDAERMLFTLQSGYEDGLARYLTAGAALERALGIDSLQALDTR